MLLQDFGFTDKQVFKKIFERTEISISINLGDRYKRSFKEDENISLSSLRWDNAELIKVNFKFNILCRK